MAFLFGVKYTTNEDNLIKPFIHSDSHPFDSVNLTAVLNRYKVILECKN